MVTQSLVDYFVQLNSSEKMDAEAIQERLWKKARLTAECIYAIHYPNSDLSRLQEALADSPQGELLTPSNCTFFCDGIVVEKNGIRVDGLFREMTSGGPCLRGGGLVLCFQIGEGKAVYYSERAGVVTKEMIGAPILTDAYFMITTENVVINIHSDIQLIRILFDEMDDFKYVSCTKHVEPITAAKKETKAKK